MVHRHVSPEVATDEAIMRVVIREGFSYDLADDLIGALRSGGGPDRQPAADLDRIARL